MPSNPELWARLDAYPLDDPDAPLPFTVRLARENGWRRGHMQRVVSEYKRFLYLTQVSDSVMTPSDAVDQVWHLHLTYTRDYWQRLCDETLGRPLHHGPTRGGSVDDGFYRTCYQTTLVLYEAEFGHPPPSDVWPDADIRFGEAAGFRRVNTVRAWVIPRPRLPRPAATAARALAAACLLLFGGASLALAQADEGMDEDALILFGVIIIFVIGVSVQIRRASRRKARRGDRHSSSAGCGGGCHCDGGSGCGSSGCGGGGCGGD